MKCLPILSIFYAYPEAMPEASTATNDRGSESASFSLNPLLFLLATLLFVAVACDGTGTGQSFPVDLEAQTLSEGSVNIDTLDEGQHADVFEGTQVVLRSQEEFKTFWEQLHAGVSEPPQLPNVDFATQAVTAVVLGERNTGGFDVSIDKVTASEDGSQMHVRFTETQPGENCGIATVLTSPYVLVAVENPGAEATFSRSVETRTC